MTVGTADLAVSTTGKQSAFTVSGTKITDSSATQASVGNPQPVNGWYTQYCTGFRTNNDSSTVLKAFTVGDVVEYVAGYKIYSSASTTTSVSKSTPLVAPLTYTVLDAAVALTMTSAAAMAVSALAF